MQLLRKMVPYLWGAVAVVLLQFGWVMLARHDADRRMKQAIRSQSGLVAPNATLASGTALRIPWFYANSGEIVRGEQAVLCYGVENAAAVWIEPAVESLQPVFNRCFGVQPAQSTTYTLVAEDRVGERVSAALRVEVRPPPPTILFVSASDKEIRRGQPWTFCYGVKNGRSVRLEPLYPKLPAVEKNCLRLFPVRTMDLSLVVADGLGRTDREKFSLTVK
jgi:hypothetical protein